MLKIVLACMFVCIPHVVLFYLAITAHKRKREPVKLQPVSDEERTLFGAGLQ